MQHAIYLLFGAALTVIPTAAMSANGLPLLNLDTQHITVSGLSSGGFMATQYHIANSDKVVGAGLIAAGPYYCARNDIGVALAQCLDKTNTSIDVEALNQQAQNWAETGGIAALSGLANSRVWMLHGSADTRINRTVSDALYQQYQQWIPEAQITYINNKPFAHLFPTSNQGSNCTESTSPYIGNCGYDAAGELLNALIDNLTPPDEQLTGRIVSLDQHAIAGDDASTLGEQAYAFIPTACETGEVCQLHVSFHGCNQYAGAIKLAYVEQTGLNRWADDNNIVVLYPQTQQSLLMPMNPQGCWDWWGYTGETYATRGGPQLKAIDALISHLSNQ